MERVPRKRQHLGKCQRHTCARATQTVSQTPPSPEDKRVTPLPPPFITIPSPFSHLSHPDPATVPLPLSPLLTEPALPIDYLLSTEFFQSLFRLHLWSTNKFHKFDPHRKWQYATFDHSLLHWYYCEEEYCFNPSPQPCAHLFQLTSIQPISPTCPNVFKCFYQHVKCLTCWIPHAPPVQLVESLKPPMSPNTVATTLAAHQELHPDILQAITNSLLTTIAQQETWMVM